MYHLPTISRLQHMHMPVRHDVAVKLQHLFKDERFWAIVGAIVLISALIIIAMFAATASGPGVPTTTLPPIIPFGY